MRYSDWKAQEQAHQEELNGIMGRAKSRERQETARLSVSSKGPDDRPYLNETLDMLSRSRGTLAKQQQPEVLEPIRSISLQRSDSIDDAINPGGVLNLERFSNMLTPRRKLKLLKKRILH